MGGSVSLTAGQRATISPEAATFLDNLTTHIPFADLLAPLLTKPSRISSFRKTLKERAGPNEERLIEKYNLKITQTLIAKVPVTIVEPPNIKPSKEHKILLNIFGGAFIMGSARDRTALLMAAEFGVRVYSISYSLAPEVRYPVARDECLAVYRQLVQDHDPKNILGMSSSAGSQLMLSMLLMAKKEGLPLPAGQYLCAPAAELSGDGDSMVSNASRDLMPTSFLIGMVKQNYAHEEVDWRDPLYSPVYADFEADFPSTVITVGTRDSMLSSGVMLYWKLREKGVKVELLVGEGMWHGFVWEEGLPEAVKVRGAVREFLESC
jgi:monoterpene epsilon-lactone hydrolase